MVELGIFGSVIAPVQNLNASDTDYDFSGILGYFLTDSLQVSIMPDINGAFDENPQGFIVGRVDYHLTPESVVVPYVGIQGGGLFARVTTVEVRGFDVRVVEEYRKEGVLGGQAGIKFFPTAKVSFNPEIAYLALANDPGDGILGFLVGISYYFR
jgi:hypothetical protein